MVAWAPKPFLQRIDLGDCTGGQRLALSWVDIKSNGGLEMVSVLSSDIYIVLWICHGHVVEYTVESKARGKGMMMNWDIGTNFKGSQPSTT